MTASPSPSARGGRLARGLRAVLDHGPQLSLFSMFTAPAAAKPAEVPAPTPAPVEVGPAVAFFLEGDRALAETWQGRARDNLHAIALSAEIAAAGRPATPQEQSRLIRFTGFGASDLANGAFRRPGETEFRRGWEEIGERLEALTSPEEYAALAQGTQYAHFTPERIVRTVWAALERFGFQGGRVLEPGIGTGLFPALMPEGLREAVQIVGIEADPVTARIAAQLQPGAEIRAEDFTETRLRGGFALAIGNPPYSTRVVRTDPAYRALGLRLHDYFICKAVDALVPGGFAAFVTSQGTMDKADASVRARLAERCDLLGAIRLPEGAFSATAGTDVGTDILFLRRRRAGEAISDTAWIETASAGIPRAEEIEINRYFVEHPGMVLGAHVIASGPFGPAYACKPIPGRDLDAGLAAAIEQLPAEVGAPDESGEGIEIGAAEIAVTSGGNERLREGSYFIADDDRLMQVIDGKAEPVAIKSGGKAAGIFPKHAGIIRSLIPIRDCVRAILARQEKCQPSAEEQAQLSRLYDAFVSKHGAINTTTVQVREADADGAHTEIHRQPNLQPFRDDPDCWLVASIEDYDLESGTATKGLIFHGTVIAPEATPEIRTAADALARCLHDHGHVDVAEIARLLGRTRAEVLDELGPALYRNPETEQWETADEYLSGKVRDKLAFAIGAADLDPSLKRNVEALEAVQPTDLPPSDITARLGQPWIPVDVIERFLADIIRVRAEVRHYPEAASWALDEYAFAYCRDADMRWGTHRYGVGKLILDALNSRTPQIFDTVYDEYGRESRQLNITETESAKEKLQSVKGAFESWVWADPNRSDRLARIYNDTFNNLVARRFDGSHLTLPGSSSSVILRPHQKRAIWRMVAAGGTMLAHAVGAGKSWTIAGAIMEQRRLGLITKAIVAVPGHCLAQFAREFLHLYPLAKILVADENNFARDRRRRFLARAAAGSWDAIIITHSAFKFIGLPAAFERQMLEEMIEEHVALIATVDKGDRLTIKQLERKKEGLRDRLRAIELRRDDFLTLGEVGIDQIVVDECFPYDTAVLTERGPIKIGDIVERRLAVRVWSYNHAEGRGEWKAVKRWLPRGRATELVRVVHERGSFVCTPNHPVATANGVYLQAGSLIPGSQLLSLSGELQPLHGAQHVLRGGLQGSSEPSSETAEALCRVRRGGHPSPSQSHAEVLLSRLCEPSPLPGSGAAGGISEADCTLVGMLEGPAQSSRTKAYADGQPDAGSGSPASDLGEAEWPHLPRSWRERSHYRAAGDACISARIADGVRDRNCTREGAVSEPPALLQGGFGRPRAQAGDRGGREFASNEAMEVLGSPQDGGFVSSRVVSVTVLECGGAYWPSDLCGESDVLYDLEVEDNHNFVAAGVLVHNCQEFRKLTFTTNMSALKGVDSEGSQMAWDLYAKARYLRRRRSALGLNGGVDRALNLASGTPITNTLGEMFTLQRFMDPDGLAERQLQEFDAWAASFGETKTELELQPSGRYKPITRFSQFVNVPELISQFRSFADVVSAEDLRLLVKRPDIAGGKRRIITAPATESFRAYQKDLDARIKAIEERTGQPKPGDDIILSVIGDGRHAALDMRLVVPGHPDEAENKLNRMIGEVHRIHLEHATKVYNQPDGTPFDRPGASQMIFCDLGTLNAEAKRGWSAYRWIKHRLVQLGIPASEIAFVQDYKGSQAKARLFADMRAGKVRITIGSTKRMGTGVNAQNRMVALHHLDVPWLPSDIEQREGRIDRQGNQNPVIEILAYATEGSMDATMWQANERKARFIAAALSGDRSIRRLEDVGEGSADQFAMAKAIASGDPRLMQKAGLEAEISRLVRLRDAHHDEQHSFRARVRSAERTIAESTVEAKNHRVDIARCEPMGETFSAKVGGRTYTDRTEAGRVLLKAMRDLEFKVQNSRPGRESRREQEVAEVRGFTVRHWASLERAGKDKDVMLADIEVMLTHHPLALRGSSVTPGAILFEQILEIIDGLDERLTWAERRIAAAEAEIARVRPAIGRSFDLEGELAEKRARLSEITEALAKSEEEPQKAAA